MVNLLFIDPYAFTCILPLTGSIEEVRNVEDQFLNDVYTPDFLAETATIEGITEGNTENDSSGGSKGRKRKREEKLGE